MSVDPSKLRIQIYPAEVLRRKAREIEPGLEAEAVGLRMLDLMRGAEGIGLAGPQVGLDWRIFVCHVPPGEEPDPEGSPPSASSSPGIYLNPSIVEHDGPLEPYDEGCLSLPGVTGEVNRPATATMEAMTPSGETVRLTATGLLARCWQHEIDHLDGVLILDKMTQASRARVRSRVRQMEKAGRR
ncbi:MAG: peptide deformylase [Planctomycetota bacterium]